MSLKVHIDLNRLCKVMRWAHSHGTICSLIPSVQQVIQGSHDNVLTPEPGQRGSKVLVITWGCSAGHAYRWSLGDHGYKDGGSANNAQERIVVGQSEGEESSSGLLDVAGCESSATDEDEEPSPAVKRGGTTEEGARMKRTKQEVTYEGWDAANVTQTANALQGQSGEFERPFKADEDEEPSPAIKRGCTTEEGARMKRIKQEVTSEGWDAANVTQTASALQGQSGEFERAFKVEMELLEVSSCEGATTEEAETCSYATGSTEQAAGAGSECRSELERLSALLSTERSRNRNMSETISSLKQDKEALKQELNKRAELICDFLRDKLRADRRWLSPNPTDPGSSHVMSSDDVNLPTRLDSSFDELEIPPLEIQRTLTGKRSREGECTRVRIKNVAGVIARYMAALQEFRRSLSMKVAFDRVGVDRNTISRTAAIAELSLAAPEVFQTLAPWDDRVETLAHYSHRCRQAMDDGIKVKIKIMKAKGELLPIVSK